MSTNPEWHHIACTYDGSSTADGMSIYVDGVLHNGLVSPDALTASILNDSSLRIESREGRNFFRGVIDEVRIYNRVLAADEIWALYSQAVDETPPISGVLTFEGDEYWQELEPGQSFTVRAAVADESGAGNADLYYRYSLDNWTDDVAWKKAGWEQGPADGSPVQKELPFADEFTGTSLDPAKWKSPYEDTPESTVTVGDSLLRVEAASSGGLVTRKVYSLEGFYYGSLEFRAKVPGWEDGGVDQSAYMGFMGYPYSEDMAVVLSGDGADFFTAAWPGHERTRLGFDLREWHTYRIEWVPRHARLYVDGELLASHSVGIPDHPLSVGFRASVQNDAASEIVVDYVRATPAWWAEWEFTPEKYGYYEFVSVATDSAGNVEDKDDSFRDNLAEANVRVLDKLVKVVVILARPSGDPMPPLPQDVILVKEAWRNVDFGSYFDEVSYGAISVLVRDVFPAGDTLYGLGGTSNYYQGSWQRNEEFVKRAIDMADSDVDFDKYDITLVGGNLIGQIGTELAFATDYTTSTVLDSDPDIAKNYVLASWSGSLAINLPAAETHEVAHQLGRVIREDRQQLPDLYKTAPNSQGNVEEWDLMGSGHPIVHLSSWSKEYLGWLEYDKVGLWITATDSSMQEEVQTTYWENWVDASPTLDYGGSVYRHTILEAKTSDFWLKTDVILETRTRNQEYSTWDTGVPLPIGVRGGLVIYQVTDRNGVDTSVNVVSSPVTPGSAPPLVAGRVRFGISEEMADEQKYSLKIFGMEETSEGKLAIMHSVPYQVFAGLPMFSENSDAIYPDLDLHAYTRDGLHVGANYETDEYEMQIPGAVASGDLNNGTEWIRLPENTEAYFTVSSRDVARFMENNPGVIENENGVYIPDFRHYDENGNGFVSPPVAESIGPGAEVFVDFSIVQNPDGTLSVATRPGLNLPSLEAWQGAIDNISDDVFTKNPDQMRNALKNKLGAVFNMIEENDCRGAADKLANDILKKLDADGKADWVREPVLANEITAFTGLLKSRVSS